MSGNGLFCDTLIKSRAGGSRGVAVRDAVPGCKALKPVLDLSGEADSQASYSIMAQCLESASIF